MEAGAGGDGGCHYSAEVKWLGRAESSSRRCERCGEPLAETGWRRYDPIDLVGATVLGSLLVGLLILFGFMFMSSSGAGDRRILPYYLLAFVLLPYGSSKLIGQSRSARICRRCPEGDRPAKER